MIFPQNLYSILFLHSNYALVVNKKHHLLDLLEDKDLSTHRYSHKQMRDYLNRLSPYICAQLLVGDDLRELGQQHGERLYVIGLHFKNTWVDHSHDTNNLAGVDEVHANAMRIITLPENSKYPTGRLLFDAAHDNYVSKSILTNQLQSYRSLTTNEDEQLRLSMTIDRIQKGLFSMRCRCCHDILKDRNAFRYIFPTRCKSCRQLETPRVTESILSSGAIVVCGD